MKINILGVPYQVEEVEHIPNTINTIGEIQFLEQKILLKKSLPKELKEQTLLHEIVHGIFQGIGEDELGSNERLVQSIATSLHQLFKSNNTIFSLTAFEKEKHMQEL